MNRPMSSTISCIFCDDWVIDVTPWISGRCLTWPHPVAHLFFLLHRNKLHAEAYRIWYAKTYPDAK